MTSPGECWLQYVEYSDCLNEEALLEPGGGCMDAPVTTTSWQEGKESMRRVGGVEHNASGLPDAAVHLLPL